MNKELIEILISLRIWSIDYSACKGGFGELEIANKCDFKCNVCPIFQTNNPQVYSNQIVSIPLN
ncbi:hypothetical protein KNV79_gp32 [Salmonella phage vB_SalP_TR2]|uniref:Radical SAM protein n=1 Tax=Salmonella phage vB_SalP_TR2 TaxID=2812854 RepID=A0A898KAV7_9CAUD|nr:hypothetical protein KNV79_gp32 [Salmonella phage vB_SalP_TR2]QSJ04008.1 hypothetical protein [Salmonella phage vB_SalP_TR2]